MILLVHVTLLRSIELPLTDSGSDCIFLCVYYGKQVFNINKAYKEERTTFHKFLV